MTKHILDHGRSDPTPSERPRRFVSIERDRRPSTPAKMAQREARSHGKGDRLVEYTRIDRDRG